jgi:TonB family protein
MRKTGWLMALLILLAGPAWAQQELAPSTDDGPLNIKPVQPKPDKDGVYSPGPGIPAPIVIQRVAAEYPTDVPEDAVAGECVLSLVIDADGIPSNIQIVHTHGAQFDNAAINAVKQSTYSPGTLNGVPVPVHIFIRTRFFNDRRVAYLRILNRYDPVRGYSQPSFGVARLPRLAPSRAYDKPPIPSHSEEPEYSTAARQEKIQGVVIVSALVTEDGFPTDLRVERSLGHGLDEKALECVAKYRFEPAEMEGSPVAARIMIELNFRLY